MSRDVSPNSSSDQSVITDEEDVVTPVSRRRISTKCDDVSCKFCEDGDDDETNTAARSFRGFVDDALVIQILSRLPVESLLRCKSVCKHWLSLIIKDKHLIHLQSIRSAKSPRLLCIAPQKVEDGKTQLILSANLSFKTSGSGEGKAQQVVIHKVKKAINHNWFDYHIVLEPVNGLVCFIDGIKAAVRICNVSTRQVTPWIRSTLLAEENDKLESKDDQIKIESNLHPIYQMGFDPEKKEHKVFCFWRLSANAEPFIGLYGEAAGYASWEALTVGRDTKWRRISVVPDENNSIKINEVLPLFSPRRSSVYANGTIYWRNKSMSMSGEYDVHNTTVCTDYAPTDPDVIIAFDVGSEKFRVIPIPSFILGEPRGKMNRPIAMLVLGGRITLIYQMSKNTVKLWMLDDGVDKKLENCQGKGSSNWSAESITLPFELDTRFFGFHGVPTREDIILISVCRELGGKVAYLYCYDRQTKSFKKHDMDMTLSVPLHGNMSLFTTFTETLTPVLPSSTRQLELDF